MKKTGKIKTIEPDLFVFRHGIAPSYFNFDFSLDVYPRKLPPPDPNPDCRWCRGTGGVTLATTTRPCLDCLTPFEGWVWPDLDGRSTCFYTNMDGQEVEVCGVHDAGTGKVPDGAVPVGRLCRFSRPGRRDPSETKSTRFEKIRKIME